MMDAVEREMETDIRMSLEAWQRGETTFDETVADLLSLARSNGWQDIATAPFDTDVLAIRAVAKIPFVASKDEDGWITFNCGYENVTKKRFEPTHWMPLPEPPTAPLEGGKS